MTSLVNVPSTRGDAQRATAARDKAVFIVLIADFGEERELNALEIWCAMSFARGTGRCAPVSTTKII
jgi:hypothetical protein